MTTFVAVVVVLLVVVVVVVVSVAAIVVAGKVLQVAGTEVIVSGVSGLLCE